MQVCVKSHPKKKNPIFPNNAIWQLQVVVLSQTAVTPTLTKTSALLCSQIFCQAKAPGLIHHVHSKNACWHNIVLWSQCASRQEGQTKDLYRHLQAKRGITP